MIQPIELQKTRPIKLHEGAISNTTKVWQMLAASRDGDLPRVQELSRDCPALLTLSGGARGARPNL
jgi:hypothetical protein